MRAEPGDPIDADALSQDLDWLNRYPFRRTEAVFTPGTGLGASDLRLQTTTTKPWSIDVGYADSGCCQPKRDGWDTPAKRWNSPLNRSISLL